MNIGYALIVSYSDLISVRHYTLYKCT